MAPRNAADEIFRRPRRTRPRATDPSTFGVIPCRRVARRMVSRLRGGRLAGSTARAIHRADKWAIAIGSIVVALAIGSCAVLVKGLQRRCGHRSDDRRRRLRCGGRLIVLSDDIAASAPPPHVAPGAVRHPRHQRHRRRGGPRPLGQAAARRRRVVEPQPTAEAARAAPRRGAGDRSRVRRRRRARFRSGR